MTGPRKHVTLHLPRWQRVEVPPESMELARARTAHLQGVAMQTPLAELLASAYLQGITDTAAILDRPAVREMLAASPASPPAAP